MKNQSHPPVVAAILGAGNMGTRLGKALRQINEVNVRYVYSRQLAKAQVLAQELEANAVEKVEIALVDPQVDVVVICLPTFSRVEILKAAVKSGKHIFCEKPLALNPTAAKEIESLLTGYPGCIMVGQVLRFFWEYKQLRKMVLDGVVGQIGTVRMSRCVGYPGQDSWFTDPLRSGGIILDLLIHDIDFLLWTFGDIEHVFAQSLTEKEAVQLDYALLNLQMRSGALAHIEGSWAHPVGSFRQTVEICGNRGVLDFDSQSAHDFQWISTCDTGRSGASRISFPEVSARNDPYFAEISHFIECVRNQQPPVVSWREALKACEVAFLAIESAQRRIPMPSAG